MSTFIPHHPPRHVHSILPLSREAATREVFAKATPEFIRGSRQQAGPQERTAARARNAEPHFQAVNRAPVRLIALQITKTANKGVFYFCDSIGDKTTCESRATAVYKKKKGCRFDYLPWGRFSCVSEFLLGTLASSHSPKTCTLSTLRTCCWFNVLLLYDYYCCCPCTFPL